MQRARFFRAISHVVLGLILLALAVAPQTSGTAAESQRAPRFDVVAVLDTSLRDGQNAKNLEDQKRALTKYVRSLPPAIRVSIVTIGKFPTVIRDLTNERDATVVAVTDLTADGDAALLDGLVLAADQFETIAESKKQIVMFTDGNDQSSSSTIDLVRTRLLNDAVRVDAITFSTANANRATIDLLTSSTGGQAVAATDLKGVVDLATRTTEWARPASVVIPKPESPSKKLLSSPILRYVLMGLVFIAVLMAMLSLTAPGPEKLNLTGAKDDKKSGVGTPVSGLAERMTQVADKAIAKQGRTKGINASLERAGMNLRPGEFVVLAMALGTAFGAVAVLKFGLYIGAPAGFVGMILGAKIFLGQKIKKRSAAFGEQLSDTLQLLSSSLRAGQSMMQALDSVSKEGDPPASEEFRRVIVEARLGRDVVDAMKAMADRVQSEDFGWVVPAIEINREVGGDLAEVLDTVAKTIRDRADLRRQVKTLSAEGRFSAFVLLGLPIAITLIIRASNPTYIAALGSGKGLYLAGGGVALMVIGAVWLMKICKIEF